MSRVHILGAGAVGLLHAHHLSKIPNLSVCLLRRHSPNTRTQTIQVANIDGSLATTTLSVASAKNLQEPISHLLVTTKSYDAVEALESVRPHLSKTPIIMLLTNGVLGVYDELTSNPPFEGAKFMLGYTTHGCIKTTETSVTHTGQGETRLGFVDGRTGLHLLPSLSSPTNQLQIQYSESEPNRINIIVKLIANACINPLTALLTCRNGGLTTQLGTFLTPLLVKEAYSLFPELGKAGISESEITDRVVSIARKTALNLNSMQVDVSQNRRTEVEYLNGYLVQRAKLLGFDVPRHDLIVQMMRIKSELTFEYKL